MLKTANIIHSRLGFFFIVFYHNGYFCFLLSVIAIISSSKQNYNKKNKETKYPIAIAKQQAKNSTKGTIFLEFLIPTFCLYYVSPPPIISKSKILQVPRKNGILGS
mmetsp:Transcript_20517/g.31665  ORF Transcript_20517/g.31665 Transcript_20517/m.31665 type:complete len:106 (+) Transcript_20517:105-422(+)